jgi:hypothetical protein
LVVLDAQIQSRCENVLANQPAETTATLDANLVLLCRERD